MTLVFGDLPLAQPGPEGTTQPTAPAPGPTGTLSQTRKRACGNLAMQLDPTKVCALIGETSDDVIIGLPANAQSAIVIPEAENDTIPDGQVLFRFWMDGTWPSTIAGIPAYAGQPFEIIGLDDLQNFRCLSNDGNQHVLQVQYFTYL